jgi:hypothetical protein
MASRLVLAALFALGLPLAAQAQAPACPVAKPAALLPGAMAADDATPVTLGTPVQAGLHPVTHLTFALTPSRKPEGYGGLFALDVASAGNYRVSLGSRAWVDVLQNGKEMRGRTAAPAGGCSPFLKAVEFTLAPGKAIIQLPSNAEPSVALLVEKLP